MPSPLPLQLIGTPLGQGTSGVATSFSNNVPNSVINSDCLFWTMVGQSATSPSGTLAGWTLMNASTTTGLSLTTYYRFAENEPSSYSTSGLTLSSTRWASVMQAIRGVDINLPFDLIPANANGGTTTTTVSAITPNSERAWILAFAAQSFASGVTPGTFASSNFTVDGQFASSAGAAVNVLAGIAHFDTWTSGSVTPNGSNSAATTRTLFQRTVLRPSRLVGCGIAA